MASGWHDELAKAVGVEPSLVLPDVVAGDIHVLPAERRQGGKVVRTDPFAPGTKGIDRAPEIDGVPQDDGSGDEVERRRAPGLVLERAIAEAAETVDADRAGERVARLALK